MLLVFALGAASAVLTGTTAGRVIEVVLAVVIVVTALAIAAVGREGTRRLTGRERVWWLALAVAWGTFSLLTWTGAPNVIVTVGGIGGGLALLLSRVHISGFLSEPTA